TGAARWSDLAEELFWGAQCRGEPFCRTDSDGECDVSEAATASVDLCDGSDCSALGWTPGADPFIHPSARPSVNDYYYFRLLAERGFKSLRYGSLIFTLCPQSTPNCILDFYSLRGGPLV